MYLNFVVMLFAMLYFSCYLFQVCNSMRIILKYIEMLFKNVDKTDKT